MKMILKIRDSYFLLQLYSFQESSRAEKKILKKFTLEDFR